MIYIFMGPSASGKSTIAKNTSLKPLISHTTRDLGKGEKPGEEYYFISKKEWKKKFKNKEFVEHTKYSGNFYSLSYKEIESKLEKHQDVYTIMDKNGVKQMKENYNTDKIKVIYVTAPKWRIFRRLLKRKRNGIWEGIKRFFHAISTGEFKNKDMADLILNGDKGNLEKNVFLMQEEIDKNKHNFYKNKYKSLKGVKI